MAFTADELQSLNDIFDRKLSAHRREMERAFDQRIQLLRRDVEQRFMTAQREIIQTVAQKLAEQQKGLQGVFTQKHASQQLNLTQALSNELRMRQQQLLPQFEGLVDRALAAQLLAIEELLDQHNQQPLDESTPPLPAGEQRPHFEAIEVQTELPWEDLVDIFGKALDERLAVLKEAMQATMQHWEHYLSLQLQTLQGQVHDDMLRSRQQAYPGNLSSMQEVFQSIEQLERIIESMQTAMTANHALLSNRLYHHQQLPLERAHASGNTPAVNVSQPNGTGASRSLTGERGSQKESNG